MGFFCAPIGLSYSVNSYIVGNSLRIYASALHPNSHSVHAVLRIQAKRHSRGEGAPNVRLGSFRLVRSCPQDVRLAGDRGRTLAVHRYDLDSGLQSREKIEAMANLGPDEISERYRNAC